MPRFEPSRIRRYYDRHTPAFVGLGEGRQSGAIHRAVWGPGVRRAEDAIHYVDDQIAATIRPPASALPDVAVAKSNGASLHVVDLGCGVGASLIHMAQQLPIRGTGITLSPVQARLAAQKVRAAGLEGRVKCIEADFCALPPAVERADAAFAIESFVHVADASRFFEQCRELLRPGGLLIICDDFRSGAAFAASRLRRGTREAAAASSIERFCEGWHVNTLVTPEELRARADEAGFEHEDTRDLSSYLRIRRPRDRVIGAFLRVLDWLPVDRGRFDDLVGGHALQTCLQHGWITYQLVVFRRT